MFPRIAQSPTAPDFVASPYHFYDRIRALGDFVFWEDWNMVMATSHEAVKAVLTHPAVGRELPVSKRASRPKHLTAFHRMDDRSLLRIEDPEHTRLWHVAREVLSNEMVSKLARQISQLCDELIDTLPTGVPFDLQQAYADKVPGVTMMRFLGLPDEMHTQMQIWARQTDGLMLAQRDRKMEDAAERAASEFQAYMTAHLAELKGQGGSEDFIGHILKRHKTLDDDDVISLVFLVVKGGTEGISHSIGTSVLQLIQYPEKQLALVPEHIEATVEECLRFEPPLQNVHCYAQEDVTILDQRFERDTMIGCLLGSACHDDAVWPDGNIFDPFRPIRAHMAYGAGIHACIGKSFVRVIKEIALPALFSRCPTLQLSEEPEFSSEFLFRGLERLKVQV